MSLVSTGGFIPTNSLEKLFNQILKRLYFIIFINFDVKLFLILNLFNKNND